MEFARNQLHSHIAVDELIKGIDQRFTESMRVRAARVAKFAYGGSRFATMHFNSQGISNAMSTAENSAATSFEFESPSRAMIFRLPSETLPLPESAGILAPLLFSYIWQTRVPETESNPGTAAFLMTADVPIDLETEVKMPLDSPASPLSFSSSNTSQTRVVFSELPTVMTSPHNVKTRHKRQ